SDSLSRPVSRERLVNASPSAARWTRTGGGLTQHAQQLAHGRAERGIDDEEEQREQRGHDDHHQRGHRRLLARRPDDLGRLDLDLVDEFAGTSSRHVGHTFLNRSSLNNSKRYIGAARPIARSILRPPDKGPLLRPTKGPAPLPPM